MNKQTQGEKGRPLSQPGSSVPHRGLRDLNVRSACPWSLARPLCLLRRKMKQNKNSTAHELDWVGGSSFSAQSSRTCRSNVASSFRAITVCGAPQGPS